jgi:SAM-dependent methyltransferase
MGTQDSYGDEKGIKAPPGARGEYTERPRGNYGGPGGSIGVDPTKFKVDYSDEHKRNQIPPMFLPAAAKEEIDNEDEPEDDEGGKHTRDFERGLLTPQPTQPQQVMPAPVAPVVVPAPASEPQAQPQDENEADYQKEMAFASEIISGQKSIKDYEFYADYAETVKQESSYVRGNVIFVGSGPVPITPILLAQDGHNVTGLDISQEANQAGEQVAAASGVQISTVTGDGAAYDYSAFDTVLVALEAGATPEQKGQLLQQIAKTAKPGATIILRSSEAPNTPGSFVNASDIVSQFLDIQKVIPVFGGLSADYIGRVKGASGTGIGFKDFFSKVTKGEFGMSDVPWEPLLPLDGLEPFFDKYVQASGNFAAHIAKSIPAFQEVQLKTGNALTTTLPSGSRVLDIGASEGNWGKAISASSQGQIATVSLDPNPDMKNTFDTHSSTPGATFEMKSFEMGFDDPAMGRVEALPPQGDFDVVHEAMAFQFISPHRANQIAEMKRHLKPGGVAMLEEKVFNDAWDQNERKKDTEYKARYFAPTALQEKDKMVGFQQSKGESGSVGMLDNMVTQHSLEETLAANFAHVIQYWDSGNFKGYAASDDLAKLRSVVGAMQSTQTQFSTVKTPRVVTSGAPRRAFNVYPVPTHPKPQDERLLLQIPHDVQERYSDLQRRVSEYVKNVKLNTLDMFSFPRDPPEKWVEEERGNVQVDWDDRDAWSAYMGRLSHDDVADWIGLESFDEGRLSALAPALKAQHALETGGTQDFSTWFRSRRPAVKDRELINYVQSTARTFPTHGLGKGYSGYWKRRNHEMVREIATRAAKDRHDRYLREVDYHNHVTPPYRSSFDTVLQSRSKHMPLSDVVTSLHSLPVEGEDRETVDGFRDEVDGIVNEGVHALDLYRPPVSRDDRMFGEMAYEGEKWVPVRRVEGSFLEGAVASPIPVPLYRYGNCYFLVHDTDKGNISPDMLMIRASVFAVQPGSSIAKQANWEWERKSRALASTINEIKGGADREATFMKYGRDYGPGLRKAISDYQFVTSNHKADGGGGASGSETGDSTCSSFTQQAPDNCDGCTFNVGTGGPEFGYGDGACLLTHLFLNAPAAGFGRGDQAAYSPQHTPGTPTVQTAPRDRRHDPRRP